MTGKPSTRIFLRLALTILASPAAAIHSFAVDLKPQTISAFDHYVLLSESKINSSLNDSPGDPQPFLWVDRLPDSQRAADIVQLRAGKVVIERLSTLDNGHPVTIPGGMIHHWIGTVFIPGATLAQTLALVEDYDHHSDYYRPQVVASKTLSRDGNDFRIYLRLYEKKILTCVLDTQHEVHYDILDATHAWSRSRTTETREVANWRESDEHDLLAGHDNGFLWRMNTYWRFEQKDGGVYVECQSISLTRDIPTGLGWLISPFVNSIPRESLQFTLGSTRKTLLTRLSLRGEFPVPSTHTHSPVEDLPRSRFRSEESQNVVIAKNTSGKPLRSLLTRLLAEDKNTSSWAVPVSTGVSDAAFPATPVEDTLTIAVLGVHPELIPVHRFRTYTSSNPFVLVAVNLADNDENATNCAVLLTFGPSQSRSDGVTPSDCTETSDVTGEHVLPCPVHRSRKYISWGCVPPVAPPRLVAVEANATNRPFWLMLGSMLAPSANVVPPGVETSCPVFGVHPAPAPMHSVTAYTSCAPPDPVPMFFAVDVNATTCPNAPEATDGCPLAPSAGVTPFVAVVISLVAGVQVVPPFKQVSRKYTSGVGVAGAPGRFVAVETNATNLPSALMATWEHGPFAGLTPSLAMDARLTVGVHPNGAPAHVLATKACGVTPSNVEVVTRFVASEMNASCNAVELIAGSELVPFAITPLGPESIRVVFGVHDAVVPKHVSNRKMSGTPFVSGLVFGG
ncbi:MAG TPA: hypothetical protein VGT03_02905 [Candidatus Acidoferrales bacterium]|nr:hypothetical protein [Candidatus Acidoferrales bacterium]